MVSTGQSPVHLSWLPGESAGAPARGRVHVWAASLYAHSPLASDATRLLPTDEVKRTSRFQRGELQQRFIRSRLILRDVLGGCVHEVPASLRFETGGSGKPALIGHPGLEFNLAHSADLLLLAVATGFPLGVDVEQVRSLKNARGIAERYFTPRESAWLERAGADELDQRFFRLWTRKEAILKATGHGISAGLETVELLDSNNGFRSAVRGLDERVWTLTELQPATGFVGALATPDGVGEVEVQTSSYQPR